MCYKSKDIESCSLCNVNYYLASPTSCLPLASQSELHYIVKSGAPVTHNEEYDPNTK